MKKAYLIDLVFIIALAMVLVIIIETGMQVKTAYMFIPFLISYYLGRYASNFIQKSK